MASHPDESISLITLLVASWHRKIVDLVLVVVLLKAGENFKFFMFDSQSCSQRIILYCFQCDFQQASKKGKTPVPVAKVSVN